jgi:glycosyltransferase involved in cell wall biosynthesis
MNVLTITSSYPRYEGDPTAPFVESIVKHVAARGHTVHVVLPATQGWNRPPSEAGVHYHPYRYSPLETWTPWGYSQSLEGGAKLRRSLYALAPVVFASALRACLAVARRYDVDVVHAHWVVPNGPIGAVASRKLGLPLVVTLHGSDAAIAERSRWIGGSARWTFENAAAVTGPSGDLLERARMLGASRLELIPWGAEVVENVPSADTTASLRTALGVRHEHVVVAGIGRLIAVKGFDHLVAAFAAAGIAHSDLRLLLIGDGAERANLEGLAHRLDVSDRVVFTGMVSRREIPSYLAAAEIVAVPSVHHLGYVDGLPTVALEAMASGKPLIASRVGGLPDIVRDGENGLLVPEKDDAALATAIVTLARDPALRARLGAAGRALVVDELNWERVAERLEGVYERARARV